MVDFKQISSTLEGEERFTQTLRDVELEEGKYDVYAETSFFSIDSKQYALNTAPIQLQVK
ncbi:hypothetical protein LCM20_04785 [Halobacillus litoralis]|uniref:hypothetical protein n=1 Tax=Halobacillus litoralis TaxID=45668 RepID=UPI001CD30E01|nr:hypothetical protein [Halobacillus litoralis]MCA0969894.1 hypothetical protein [Halobacillus litoralis]